MITLGHRDGWLPFGIASPQSTLFLLHLVLATNTGQTLEFRPCLHDRNKDDEELNTLIYAVDDIWRNCGQHPPNGREMWP